MVLSTVAAAVAATVLLVTVTVAVRAAFPTRQQRHVGEGRFQSDRGLHELTLRAVLDHKASYRVRDARQQRIIGAE